MRLGVVLGVIVSGLFVGRCPAQEQPTGRATLRAFPKFSGGALAVAFSPDGKILASSGRDGKIKLWEVKTGENTATLTGHEDSICSVAFGPDGKTVASADSHGCIKLWDAASGRNTADLKLPVSIIMSMATSADGKVLAAALLDGTVRLWDMPVGEKGK